MGIQHGSYQLGEQLGQGGFGRVFHARDVRTGAACVVKELEIPSLSGEGEEAVKRFHAELQTLQSLQQENIIQILESGHVERGLGGVVWVAMEKVEGRSLQQLVDADGPLTPKIAADLIRTLCSAIHAAHEKNLVHRNLKPENVFLSRMGRVVVTDFGLCKLGDSVHIKRTGTLSATARYMAPEDVEGRATDARSDVFSLGTLLYFLITGRHLRNAASQDPKATDGPEVMAIREHQGLPTTLKAVLVKAVAKNPSGRFASAPDLGKALHDHSLDPEWAHLVPIEEAKPPPVEKPTFRYREMETPEEPTSPLGGVGKPLIVMALVGLAWLFNRSAPQVTQTVTQVVTNPVALMQQIESPPPPPPPPQTTTTPSSTGRCLNRDGADWFLGTCTLAGPLGGLSTRSGPAVVHVWLQGCADCMPKFDAYKNLRDRGGGRWSAPIYNVAYGGATADWAREYRLDENLGLDPGSNFVSPLGIGTFTTLVFDRNSRLAGRFYPTDSAYEANVLAALSR